MDLYDRKGLLVYRSYTARDYPTLVKEASYVLTSFSEVDFDEDITGIDFTCITFADCSFQTEVSNVKFTRCAILHCHFIGRISHSHFISCSVRASSIAELMNSVISDSLFANCDFNDNLTECTSHNSAFRECDFICVESCIFSLGSFVRCSIAGASLKQVHFKEVSLGDQPFLRSLLILCNFTETLGEPQFKNCELGECKFLNCSFLHTSSFENNTIKSSSFDKSCFEKIKFLQNKIYNTSFDGVLLAGSQFVTCYLAYCAFTNITDLVSDTFVDQTVDKDCSFTKTLDGSVYGSLSINTQQGGLSQQQPPLPLAGPSQNKTTPTSTNIRWVDLTKYPNICPICGQPAYQKLLGWDCSNPNCGRTS